MNALDPQADSLPRGAEDSGPSHPDGFAYELRIGVTGHRHLRDAATVTQTVRRVLQHIDRTLGPQSRTPLEWIVVSPIAKGADRIVAEQVLRLPASRLEVLTPLELDEYRRDFVEADDRDEFEQLLQRAAHSRCVSHQPPPDMKDPATLQEWRNRAYMQVGRAVIDASEIVIAIWDGQPSRGLGGTGDVARHALSRERLVIWVDALNPSAEPLLITGVHNRPDGQLALETTPLPDAPKQLSLGYHQLDAYNRDDSLPAETIAQACQRTRQWFEQQAQAAKLPTPVIELIQREIIPQFARADRLAVHYRDRYVAATTSLFSLSALAVSIAAAQVLLFSEQLWIVVLELIAMGTAVLLWRWCRREAWHEKWIHDRYLAERWRLAIFTLLLDRPQQWGQQTPGEALAFYSGPQHWLLDAAQQLIRVTRQSLSTPVDFPAVKTFLIDAWLDNQRQYHEQNAHRKHELAQRGHQLGTWLFVATLVMVVLHLAGIGHHAGDHAPGWGRLDAWITLLTILLPVWGAAIHAITNQLELERIAARSQRMASVLNLVTDRAREAETLDELREAITEGEQVMSLENHEWWILLSFRQPVLPT